MTTTATNTSNSRSRKTLASQIDRLDTILDGLADGLNEAVAMIVKEAVQVAVREAVQAVLTELLTNPEVMARLQANLQPPRAHSTLGEKVASIKEGVAERCQTAGQACRKGLRGFGRWCSTLWPKSKRGVAVVWREIRLLPWRTVPLVVALGAGVVAGAIAYVAGPWTSALLSAVAGFVTAQAAQARLWFQQRLNSAGTRPS